MFNVPQLPDQPCDYAVLKVMNELMGVNVSGADIERCHTVGKPNTQGNRPITIKFKSYQSKAEVYKAKTQLKGNPDKSLLTEDLTKKNHIIVQKLLEMRKSRKNNSFWTTDGRINVKVLENSRPVRVRSVDEVLQLIPDNSDVKYLEAINIYFFLSLGASAIITE